MISLTLLQKFTHPFENPGSALGLDQEASNVVLVMLNETSPRPIMIAPEPLLYKDYNYNIMIVPESLLYKDYNYKKKETTGWRYSRRKMLKILDDN